MGINDGVGEWKIKGTVGIIITTTADLPGAEIGDTIKHTMRYPCLPTEITQHEIVKIEPDTPPYRKFTLKQIGETQFELPHIEPRLTQGD